MSDDFGEDMDIEEVEHEDIDLSFYPIPTTLAGVNYTPPLKAEPVRSEGSQHEDFREDHPAYGIIGVSRGSWSPGASLFGTDFLHQNVITIRLQHAYLSRGLHQDRIAATGQPWIAEVHLSEAQWATMISTLNMGEGVPCTIERLNGEEMPDIVPVRESRRAELNTEVKQTFADLDARLAELESKLTGARKRDVDIIRSHLRSNVPFVAEQFDKHADKVIEQMKIEVAAYMTNAIARAGITALGGEPPITLIEPGEPEQENKDE